MAEPVVAPATAPAARPVPHHRRWYLPMRGRDPREHHRASTPLELFFDLVFVVAVAVAAAELHHELAAGHVAEGVAGFALVFFAVWWPWMNFSWFASAYDTDDVPYRLAVFVQMVGVLIVAAGIPRVFAELDFTVVVVGYVVMRLGLVSLWLRAARDDPGGRPVALRYAIGITLVQVLWIVRLAVGGPIGIALLLILLAIEVTIPLWAERAGRTTPWHSGHIAERYGLFTIIVLGECVLASTVAVEAAVGEAGLTPELAAIAVAGLLLLFSLWWAYFKRSTETRHDQSMGTNFLWGYGHSVIFASVAALGAGIQVAIVAVTDPEHVDSWVAVGAVVVPVAIVLFAIGVLHEPRASIGERLRDALATAGIVLAAVVGTSLGGVAAGVFAAAVGVLLMVAWHVASSYAAPEVHHAPPAGGREAPADR